MYLGQYTTATTKINQQFNEPVNSQIARWVKFHKEIRPVPIQYKKLIQDVQKFPVLLAVLSPISESFLRVHPLKVV